MESHWAAVFPGQGSQAVGMLHALASVHPVVSATFAEASELFGEDLWQLVQEGPEETLNRTEYTQPLMLIAGVATWRVWTQATSLRPVAVAGHSLGEYTALVAAESLTFADALRLVRERSSAMQAAVPVGEGAIAALLGLDDAVVEQLCRELSQSMTAEQGHPVVVEAVNFNSPGQVVIAGHAAAVDRALQQASAAGAKRAKRLPMSVPAHSSLMRPAAARLRARLDATPFQVPRIPVLHNVDAQSVTDPDLLRERLERQLYHPVRWVDTVQQLQARGIRVQVEMGPGGVLTGLVKRIDRSLQRLEVKDPASLADTLAALTAPATH